ncbi:hypothetical protein HOL59_06215 [Candidatus Woesearchaeota archaeon]|jgi:hypothetical protein|nr:hypothetical protein [Candidatus Woesearchaeota archaeon]
MKDRYIGDEEGIEEKMAEREDYRENSEMLCEKKMTRDLTNRVKYIDSSEPDSNPLFDPIKKIMSKYFSTSSEKKLERVNKKIKEISEVINQEYNVIQTNLYGDLDDNEPGGFYGELIKQNDELEGLSEKCISIKDTIDVLEEKKAKYLKDNSSSYIKASFELDSTKNDLRDHEFELIKCDRNIEKIEQFINKNKDYISELGNVKERAINLLVDSEYKNCKEELDQLKELKDSIIDKYKL